MEKLRETILPSDKAKNRDNSEETSPLLQPNRTDYGGFAAPTTLESETTTIHIESSSSSGQGIHCHDGPQQEGGIDQRARRKLLIACALCIVFMIAEVVGGILANSLAIATDAAHLLTDVASFMISLFSIYLASRPATKTMSFGWYRAEVVGALVSVLLIWVVTGVLFYMAIQRVVSGDYEIDATVMLITAAVGVAINLLMGFTLHDTHGHSHGGGSHGHSHGGGQGGQSHDTSTTAYKNKKNLAHPGSPGSENRDLESKKRSAKDDGHSHTNINVRAAFIHVVGDLIQSIGVLVAAFIIYFHPQAKIADPICTFIFSALVLFTTINILRDTLNVLMEGAPKGISFNDIKMTLLEIKGVREIHNLRIWSLTMSKTALAVHLALEPSSKESDAQEILATASNLMKEKFGIYEVTVQIESYVDEMDDCTQCKEPGD